MIYNSAIEYQRKQAESRFAWLIKHKKRFEMTMKMPRTLSQNRYLFLLFNHFSEKTGYTVEEVKEEIFKKHINPDIFYKEESEGLVKFSRWRSTRDLSTSEMTTAIDRFKNYSSTKAGIYLPDPSDLVFLDEIAHEASKKENKVYNY